MTGPRDDIAAGPMIVIAVSMVICAALVLVGIAWVLTS